MKHVVVYRESGRFAGWPANYGIWSWASEIVTGYFVGYVDPKAYYHARDKSKPFETIQTRSTDGGETWQNQAFPGRTPGGRCFSSDEHMLPGMGVGEVLDGEDGVQPCEGGVDFAHPNFAFLFAKTGLAAGVRSFFYYSLDRCESWRGPFDFPMFDQTGIAARTSYLVEGREQCLFFLTANKRNGLEGRVFCAETVDGGKSFQFVSWIGPEPEGFNIMPSAVRLTDEKILVAIRSQGEKRGAESPPSWIDLYVSNDRGRSWRQLNRPVDDTGWNGNPPTLTKLLDGRLCLTYGYRAPPFGIRARLSEDEGDTWGDEITLKEDAGNHDIGYPRTVQTPDGRIVTVYYYNEEAEGERYIAATLWDPP